MEFKKLENGYVVILKKGEEVMETLANFCKEKNIKAGEIYGIGALQDVEIGYFDLKEKRYLRKKIPEISLELLSFKGNISVDEEDNTMLHCHVILGKWDYSTVGGHLFKGTVSVTGEFFLRVYNEVSLRRKKDPDTRLKLISLE